VKYEKYVSMSDTRNSEVYEGKDDVAWEDEFFHSVYVLSKAREEKKIGKKLFGGTLQIRGVDYNLEEVYMLPYFKRVTMGKETQVNNSKYKVCFTYADFDVEGNQISTSGFHCYPTRSMRDEVQWCANCRSRIIVVGFLCNANGEYILDDNKKPINIFISGTGSKFGDISEYYFETKNLPVPFLFDEPTDESNAQEQNYFNMFRRIIKITPTERDVYKGPNTPPGTPDTRIGYKLEAAGDIDKALIEKLMDYAVKIDTELRDKFDESDMVRKNAKKYINAALQNFRNSQIFKENNPNFVDNSTPKAPDGFMTIDEDVNTKPIDTNEILNTDNTPKSVGMSNIDDIPF